VGGLLSFAFLPVLLPDENTPLFIGAGFLILRNVV
jgi:hypothetical protein